jgi:V/A-type H+-transporting ATPase subunit A
MCATLGPGLLRNIFDGIQNPLVAVAEKTGDFIARGVNASALDETARWDTEILVKPGDRVEEGTVYARVPETPAIMHKLSVPAGMRGEVIACAPDGQYTIHDTVVRIKDDAGNEHALTLCRRWPIRVPRPVRGRLPLTRAAHHRAAHCRHAVSRRQRRRGRGTRRIRHRENGHTTSTRQVVRRRHNHLCRLRRTRNEMTQALTEFSEIIDPRSSRPLTDRTVLIANTSNMPVAAREASIYTGITIAEYYRDMGYHTRALMADSTSRWAEALREISGRLEEMPADEGFPAYLPSRLSEFYERAGYFRLLSGEEGSITVIGAVSPQGSDFSEPVTQNTKRFTRCFWALDKSLAYARHFPAINWTDSYSEYLNDLSGWYRDHVGADFIKCRNDIYALLLEEKKLMEIVKLIGADVLPDEQKLVMKPAALSASAFCSKTPLIRRTPMCRWKNS